MAIYEYKCKKCGNKVEELIRHDSDIPTVCKKCGGELKKIISKNAEILQRIT